MDERKPEEHTELDREERPNPLEDLDVPESESEDVKGGAEVANYSFQPAWPKKWSG